MPDDTTMTDDKKLEVFLNLSYRQAFIGDYQRIWRNLHFTMGGAGRLMNIAGYLTALVSMDQKELATQMAVSLYDKLAYLADYGGTQAVSYNDGIYDKMTGDTPAFQVIIGDDASFCSFTVSWLRFDKLWHPDMEVTQDMLHYRGTFSAPETVLRSESGGIRWVPVVYRFAFNGGLIFHGNLRDPRTVEVTSDNPSWSIHT